MKTLTTLLVVAVGFGASVIAQNTNAVATPPKDAPAQAAVEAPKQTQAELEVKFKDSLTKVTLTGRWCSVTDGKLGPNNEDKYTVVSATKVAGELWIITARVQYNQKDFTAPIPVFVRWAGDTPVITITNLPIPGAGTYTARVLIYDKTYAGTWSGGDHGGLLSGLITNEKE